MSPAEVAALCHQSGTFTNPGTIAVANGSTLNIDPGDSLTNAAGGKITVSGSGSTLDFGSRGQTWTDAGTIAIHHRQCL